MIFSWTILGCLFGVYCITSLILFIFPCYKKKNPIKIDLKGNVCILGGHRGGAWERLESTIPAFKHAKESNMNILEMDIQFTKDKKIVVHHDDTLERLTGQKEKVEQLNYDQIHKCKEVVEYPYKDGFYHQKPGIDDGTIPVLEDVFKELPGCIMNIELKVDSREMLYKLLDLILEYKREHITYIGTNIEELNNIAYELTEGTGIRTFAGTWYIIRTTLLYFLGLLPFFDFKYYSVWFPFYEIGAATLMSAEHHHTWYFQLVEVLVSIILVPMRPMFWHLRRRGIQIILFVINYGELADRALKYPMDGFITEIPQGMQDYLSK